MVVLGFVVALEMIFYFASIRDLERHRRRLARVHGAGVGRAAGAVGCCARGAGGIDLIAVAVAVGGMALLVLPAATAGDGAVTVPGVVFGLLAGLMFAAAMMLVSSMSDAGVRGSTFALFYCAGSVILFTPLAVWQTAAERVLAHLDGRLDRRHQRPRVHGALLQPLHVLVCGMCAWSTRESLATLSL